MPPIGVYDPEQSSAAWIAAESISAGAFDTSLVGLASAPAPSGDGRRLGGMFSWLRGAWLAGAAMLNSPAEPEPEPSGGLVVIGATQSNGVGFAVASAMSNYPGISTPYANVQMFERGAPTPSGAPAWSTWQGDLRPRPVTIAGQVAGTCGIELTMMRALDTAIPGGWYVSKCCANSTGLEDEWKTATYLDQLKTDIATRCSTWGTSVAAFVMIIGETDSAESPDADNTFANLVAIFDDLRATFGDFPIVIVRLASQYTLGGDGPAVRAGQEAFVAANPRARILSIDSIDGVDVAYREGLTGTHWTDNLYGLYGEKVAELILEIIQETPRAAPRYMGSTKPVIAGSGATLTPNMPPEIAYQVGDRMYFVVCATGNTPYGAPTNWIEVGVQHSGSATDPRLHVYEHVVESKPVPAPTLGDLPTDDQKLGTVCWVRGAGAIAASSGNTSATSTSIAFPTVNTTGVDHCLILDILAHHVDLAVPQVTAWANDDLVELREQIDECRVNSTGYGFALATGVMTTGGVVPATTATLANTSPQARLRLAVPPA